MQSECHLRLFQMPGSHQNDSTSSILFSKKTVKAIFEPTKTMSKERYFRHGAM